MVVASCVAAAAAAWVGFTVASCGNGLTELPLLHAQTLFDIF